MKVVGKENYCQQKQLNYRCSMALKGIAIVFMIVHHTLGLPEQWFEEGLGYGQTVIGNKMLYELIGNPTKICVSVFAFLTGWSYFYHNTPTFKYGIKKAVQVLVQYWMVLFLIFYPAAYIISGYYPTFKDVVFNLFSIHNRAISFSWYILFYVLCICSLPVLVRFVTNKWWIDFCSVPIAFTLILNVLNHIEVQQKKYLLKDLQDYFYWMPIVWVAYLIAKYDVFTKIQQKIQINLIWKIVFGMGIVLIPVCRGLYSEFCGMNVDVIYGPIFVFSCMIVLNEKCIPARVFMWLGKYSMYIWLIHSIFFWEKTRKVFQPMVYSVNQPVISILLILIISVVLAIPLYYSYNTMVNHKNKQGGV